MKIFNYIKDIIAPKKCYSCSKEGHFLCEECFIKTPKFDEICYICKSYSENYKIHDKCKNNIYFDSVIILNNYNNLIIKKLIRDGKYYRLKDIFKDLGNHLSNLLIKSLQEEYWVFNKNDFIITSSPMNIIKKILRGYNQAEILANKIGDISSINTNNKLIIKKKHTRQQSFLNKKQRQANLNNAFKINKKEIDNIDKKTIILVDDVISTGTTLNKISKLLKQNGAKKIICLCIASD